MTGIEQFTHFIRFCIGFAAILCGARLLVSDETIHLGAAYVIGGNIILLALDLQRRLTNPQKPE